VALDGHPSAVLVPAILAQAEASGSSCWQHISPGTRCGRS
jgi:2-methylcitrate dehydratase PrpD